MAADDQKDSEELQRRQTLEEIRHRAEEAELKRIEELEKQAGGNPPPPTRASDRAALEEVQWRAEERERKRLEREDQESRPEVPVPRKIEPPPIPPLLPRDPNLELRDKLSIALDRGRLEKATALFAQYSETNPDEDELEEFRTRLSALESEQLQTKKKKRSTEALSSADREANQKKIKAILEAANGFYQREKYQKGLDSIQEILSLDAKNEDALQLQEQIEKAQRLAEQIKEEENRRKEEQPAAPAPPVPLPSTTPTGDDVWGSRPAPGDASYEVPDFTTPPPQPSRIVRIADRLSRVRISRKMVTGMLLVVVLAAVAYLVNTFRKEAFRPDSSLLIFPSEVSEADSSARFLADGIMHDVIGELGTISALRVVAPMTALTLRGGLLAARTVGANYFLQSKFAQSPAGVEVQLVLYDTTSRQSVWNATITKATESLPAVRHEIARAVLGAMKIKSAGGGNPSSEAGSTGSAAAYEAYARGQALLLRSGRSFLAAAKESFATAVQRDPKFANAWVALAWTHLLIFEAESEPAISHVDTASMYAQEAIVRGLKSADVFRVLGVAEQFRANFDRALAHLENAVSIAPGDAEIQRRVSEVYVIRGRNADALRSARTAALDDPLNIGTLTNLGFIQQFQRDFRGAKVTYEAASRLADDPSEYKSGYYLDVLVYVNKPELALEILRERIERMPESSVDYYKLGRVYQSAGGSKQQWEIALQRARELIDARLESSPLDARALSLLSLVRARLGRYNEALAAKARALEIAPNDPVVLLNIARMHTIHRDKPEALEYVKKALAERYQFSPLLDMDFFNLRSDPDFLAAISR